MRYTGFEMGLRLVHHKPRLHAIVVPYGIQPHRVTRGRMRLTRRRVMPEAFRLHLRSCDGNIVMCSEETSIRTVPARMAWPPRQIDDPGSGRNRLSESACILVFSDEHQHLDLQQPSIGV